MSLNYGGSFDGKFSRGAYFGFLTKRFARVYPLYAFLTLLVFGLSLIGLLASHVRLQVLVINLLLIQQLGPGVIHSYLGDSVLGGAWSISTEFGAYLLFPVLYLVSTRSKRTQFNVLLAMVGGIVAMLCFLPGNLKPQQLPSQGVLDIWSGWNLWPLVRCLAEFMAGILIQHLSNSDLYRWFSNPAIASILATLLLILLLVPYGDFFTVLAITALVLHLGTVPSAVGRALASPFPIWLGEVSYAVYLLHFAVITMTFERPVLVFRQAWFHQNFPLVFAVTLMMLLILSRVSFIFIEKPARDFIRRLTTNRAIRTIESEPAAP